MNKPFASMSFFLLSAAIGGCFLGWFAPALAQAEEKSTLTRSDYNQARTDDAARQSAIQSIPLDKLDAQGRAKVHSVLTNTTMYRRMPIRIIDCDPDLYLFAVRHPDVMVNIWQALKLSRLQLEQKDADKFHLKETSGTTADLEILYHGRDVNLIYAEGSYEGALLPKPVKGDALFLLKSAYLRESDGRYYISSRLDVFLSIEPGAVELVTKAISPLLGATADNNFTQTVAFMGSLSRTTEMNSRSVQRLAAQLKFVKPEVREEFSDLADKIAAKPSAVLLRKTAADKPAVSQRDNGSKMR